ncbi:adenosylcobinamide-GDP ribazoletransferase [Craterilacuibacter sp. RT1T]|uniref:adenosylcobinamide-GDP ribazoletransferase n=1 Tax=Craterilacuibacter sp. RT1T TaxID=2942211 RepID=UPI0020C0138A|nr:adenosylcobinamide-GDP ribazoletransferase [Craterilacuibacter sp. RT1T]MCL6264205.1 adenosylcobinamide-GDP ribazoletransferase [Craterilacuibacter sp. RT1T]
MRSLILAVQFLTRLPTPQLKHFDPAWLADAARWFAVVGLLVGALIALPLFALGQIEPWLAALAALLLWVWVTGGLHLDGLADLADALGAAHSSPQRFMEVMKDPHVGSFGVIVLVCQLAAKLVLLMLVARAGLWAALLLVPAWARLFAVAWSATLPPLAAGSGERFAWRSHWPSFFLAAAALAGLSAWLSPALLAAPLAGLLWWAYLKNKLGGMSGDCLGAGIEVSETLLLVLLIGATLIS